MEFSPSELWSTEARRDRLGFYARVRDAGSPVPQIEPGTGRRFWVVARYSDVRDGLLHPDIGHGSGGGNPRSGPAWESAADRVSSRQLISLDPPDHTRLRALVNAAFTARVVDRLAPWITDVVDGLLDRLAASEVIDGVSDLAAPVPVSVIAELVGIPEEDRTQFREWSRLIISGGAPSRVATAEFADYIEGIAAHRRTTPEDDLLSGLVALENDGASLDRDELVAMTPLCCQDLPVDHLLLA